MTEPGFTTAEVCRFTGLGIDRVDYWARTGFLRPSIREATGTGSMRLYAFNDVVAARVARALREGYNFPLQRLRRVVDHLRNENGLDNPLAEARLVVAGDDVFLVRSETELISILTRPGQRAFSWILDLAPIIEEVRAAIAEAA